MAGHQASCPFPPSVPQGDSGGPLVCNNVAQGIVSYGDSNGIPPAVFTKIQSFIPWIKRTMRRLAPGHQGPTDSLSGAQTSSRGFP